MRKLVLASATLALLLIPLCASAQTSFPVNEVRVGWGDPMFETAAFYNNSTKNDYRYSGHFFAEYQHNFLKWLGVGFETDFERVSWNVVKDGSRGNYYNLSFFPTVRFTYFRKGIVTMYSGLGVGLNFNGGTETDYLGRKTICAPLVDITAYAISLDFGNFCGTFEIGALNSVLGKNTIFMAGSRLLSLSIGYRF